MYARGSGFSLETCFPLGAGVELCAAPARTRQRVREGVSVSAGARRIAEGRRLLSAWKEKKGGEVGFADVQKSSVSAVRLSADGLRKREGGGVGDARGQKDAMDG